MLTLKDCLNDNILDDDFVTELQDLMKKIEPNLKKRNISYNDMCKLLDIRLLKGNKLYLQYKKVLDKYFSPSFVNGGLQGLSSPYNNMMDYSEGKYLGVVLLLLLGSKNISPEQNLIVSPNLWRNVTENSYQELDLQLFPIEEEKGFYIQTKHNPFKDRSEEFMNYGSMSYIMVAYRPEIMGVIKDFYVYRDNSGNVYVTTFPNKHGLLNNKNGAVDIPNEDVRTFKTLEKSIIRTENKILDYFEKDIQENGEFDYSEDGPSLENQLTLFLEKKYQSPQGSKTFQTEASIIKYEINKLICLEVIKSLSVSLHLKSGQQEVRDHVINNSKIIKYPEEEKIFPYNSKDEEIANPEALNNYRIARLPPGAVKVIGVSTPEGYDSAEKIEVNSYKSRRWVLNDDGDMTLKVVTVTGYKRTSRNRKLLKEIIPSQNSASITQDSI